jgi:glycerol-3-phosphate dehydrogenase
VSAAERESRIADLRGGRTFDLLVIGGGATGCGIAVDAATRGLSVALVERNDFAEGTSSRSTKLLHGGVRYLEAAVKKLDRTHLKLVLEALQERGALLANAPHLSRKLALITPLYSWWEAPYVYVGLKLYDLLSGRRSIGASRFLSRKQALARFPGLKADGLKAAVLYHDGQFVDSRLVVALVRTARANGAVLANQVEATALTHDQAGKVDGAELHDKLSGERWTVKARAVINATGPFADGVAKLDDRRARPMLTVSSGAHIVLDKSFVPDDTGLLIPKTHDGRVLFVLPWQGHALVGTTDEAAVLEEHPRPTSAETAYLLDYVRRIFGVEISADMVKSSWSGLRPLAFDPKAKNSAELARDHVLIVSPSGLITITGGKWTTYRLMSEQTVDHAVAQAGLAHAGPCRTAKLKLFDPAEELAALAGQGWSRRLHPDHPYTEADVLQAVRREDAVHAIDVLARRLTMALVDRKAAREAAPKVIELMAAELRWDEARRAEELALVERRLDEAL